MLGTVEDIKPVPDIRDINLWGKYNMHATTIPNTDLVLSVRQCI